MPIFPTYASLGPTEAAARLSSSEKEGLSLAAAEARLRQDGANTLAHHRASWAAVLARQFRSPFVYLLAGAGALSFFLGEMIDSGMIVAFILANALLGFYQEYHSERAVALLSQFITATVAVIRGGKEKAIDSKDLVAGDLVVLKAGDVVPADLRLIETHDFTVDESALTGESTPVTKSPDPGPAEAYYQATQIAFSGTVVLGGIARGLVFATGTRTALGEIAKLAETSVRSSNFEKSLGRFSSFILRLTLITLGFVFIAHLAIKGAANVGQLAVFAVALGVSVIPEGLPVVTTFSLSRGALRLAKRKVVVKRLSAIEDLGGIEVLCTDKTGTITENRMRVAAVHGDRGKVMSAAALGGAWPSEEAEASTFDRPLWEDLPDDAGRDLIATYRKTAELPFDPERKRNSVLLTSHAGKELVVRGAPESILPFCKNEEARGQIEEWIVAQGLLGRRVLAIARKAATDINEGYGVDEETKDIEALGAVAFADPIKPSTVAAIAHAEKLGLGIKILTGDSLEVAIAVGKEAGLITEGGQAITGKEFSSLSYEAQHKAVEEKVVFARMAPEEKHRVIHLLQEKYSVGFLGDGINDAPALKIADVGLVVNGATDIARESADVVLLQNSLEVIVNGIREGRSVLVNTVKYIKSTLSSNFGNFYAVAFGSLIMDVLPMLPLQLLLLNLLSDSPMMGVAADRVDDDEVARPQSYHIREITFLALALGIVSTVFDFIFFGLFYREAPAVLQTNWFIGSIVTELLFLFSVRTRKFFLSARPVAPILGGLTAIALAAAIVLPYTPLGKDVFQFTPPSPQALAMILGISLAYLIATETAKLLYFRYESEGIKRAA